jgi:hypothetical protein
MVEISMLRSLVRRGRLIVSFTLTQISEFGRDGGLIIAGLLEEKGVHHEVGATSSPVGKEDVGADAKADKPKLSERIKAKLHIHGKDKD